MSKKEVTKKAVSRKTLVTPEVSRAAPIAKAAKAKSVKQKAGVVAAQIIEADAASRPELKKTRSAKVPSSANDILEIPKAVSPAKKRATKTEPQVRPQKAKAIYPPVAVTVDAMTSKVAVSPAFRTLAAPILPELRRENRARLQMQTPTRLYFYWSLRNDPWQMLRAVFGDTSSYTLVLKLTDLLSGAEEMFPADAEGSWWFDVEPDGSYRAEVGFYAPNRPYFRVIYSNTVETPRRSPSPRPASESEWRVSANQFAQVLGASGFKRDAFEVALTGDDHHSADRATRAVFATVVSDPDSLDGVSGEDLRSALISLAAGQTIEELRSHVSRRLYSVLQANREVLSAKRAIDTINQAFDLDEEELLEEQTGPSVYGSSMLNFPRSLRSRRSSRDLAGQYYPISSGR